MKKFSLIAILVMALAVAVVACGGGAAPTAAPATSAPQATTAPQGGSGVVQLVYMRQAEGIQTELDFIDQWNKTHPNIQVKVDSDPGANNYSKLAMTTESGTPPDVFMTYFTIGAATNGLAMDLTPFIKKEGDAFFKKYALGAWQFNQFGDKYYGIPYRVAPFGVILNKKVAQDAGVPLPSNRGWSWDEFVSFAQKLTNPDKGVYGFCLTGSAEATGTDAQFQAFLFSNGGKMIGPDGLAAFNSPQGVETVQWLSDVVNKDKITPPGVTSATENACPDMVASGKAAMWMDGSIWEGIIKNAHPGLDLMILPIPTKGAKATMNGGTGFGMSSKTKHPNEAWEFMKYLASDEVQKKWSIDAGWQPGNIAVFNDPDFKKNPDNETVGWVMQNYQIWQLSNYPDNANLEAKLRTYLGAAYLQKQTPQQAMDQAKGEWDPVLKKFQSLNWWKGTWGYSN